MEKYDLIIVGAGAAGLTAGIYATRRGLRTVVISKDLGGQASSTPEIENYPGVPLMEGTELMDRFAHQFRLFGGEIKLNEVLDVTAEGPGFTVKTIDESYAADAAILAFGKTPNDIGVPGELEFKGKQIHASAKDLDNYKDKVVAVIGGGNSAALAATEAAKVASKVYVFCLLPTMRAEKILLERIESHGSKIEVITGANTKQFDGEGRLTGMKVEVGGTIKDYKIDQAIIAVGYSNKTSWVSEMVDTDSIGQIIIGDDCSTKTPGLFAAGDVTTIPYKQIIISAGEGAKAAIAAATYLAKKQGRVAANIDWGLSKK